MLRCDGNEYDDLLTLFHFLSSETFFLQYMQSFNKNTMLDQLIIFLFKSIFSCAKNSADRELSVKMWGLIMYMFRPSPN